MHALLNGNLEDDIMFVQKPWFGRIGTARDDVLHSGKSVLRGAANAQWTLHYPRFTDRAKVMTYVRIHDRSHPFRLNKCQGTTRLDLCAHPSVMSLQGHTAQHERKVSVGSRESMVQWCDGSEEVSTTKYRQRMRGIQWIAR